MLRVAITGGPGSGKSTLSAMFAERGAHVVASDEVARNLMQPGQQVYDTIVERFGPGVVSPDRTLNRAALARIAFSEGRVRDLEAIVHPAVLAWQIVWVHDLEKADPHGVAMIESALVFESKYGESNYGESSYGESSGGGLPDGDQHKRFDRIVLVTAPDEAKRRRFLERIEKARGHRLTAEERAAVTADADRRLALQMTDEEKASRSDFVLQNDATLAEAEAKVDEIWSQLRAEAANSASK